jgi:hypothetical protein
MKAPPRVQRRVSHPQMPSRRHTRNKVTLQRVRLPQRPASVEEALSSLWWFVGQGAANIQDADELRRDVLLALMHGSTSFDMLAFVEEQENEQGEKIC